MTEADLDGGLRLSRASGWNQTLGDWRTLLSLGPGLFRVAVRGSDVVASGGAVCHGEDLAWICMILVRPDERGHGLGTRIFDEVLERARARVTAGRLRVIGLDATPAGRILYLKRGFVDGPSLVRLRRAPGTTSTTGGGKPVALTASDLEAVLVHDRSVFGADRGPVLRELAHSAPELARVVRDGDRVRGYCFGRHGEQADQLGPVVADDEALARGARRARISGRAPAHADVPRRRAAHGAARARARHPRAGVRMSAAGLIRWRAMHEIAGP